MKEFAYELTLEEVRIARDALSACPAKQFDVTLCKKLTDVLNNPSKHNCLAQPRLMSWIKRAFK